MIGIYPDPEDNVVVAKSPRTQRRIAPRNRSPVFPRAIRFIDPNKRASRSDMSHAVREGIREKNWRVKQRLHSSSARRQLGDLKWSRRSPRPRPTPNVPPRNEVDSNEPQEMGRGRRVPESQHRRHRLWHAPKPTQVASMNYENVDQESIVETERIPARFLSPVVRATQHETVASGGPRTILRSDTIDPFANLPVRVNPKARKFIHHCEHPIPPPFLERVCDHS
jgi:hypothetical protein